jgi:uncharacterized protein
MRYSIAQTWNRRIATFAVAALLGAGLNAGAAQPDQQSALSGADAAPPGTIPWQLLQQAKTVQKADRKLGPVFSAQVKALDQQTVKLYGFMMPLEQADKQTRFLLAAYPPHCAFCMPGGPESLVEVVASDAVKFSFEPIVVSGKMHVLENDIVYYRLTDAKSVKY